MKRITFLTGYYGSGKTEIALNLAIQKQIPYLVDLDIINPYFRSREIEVLLDSFHVEVISSGKEQSMYTDLPYISGRVFIPFQNTKTKAIYDLGGNDLGAKLLRQFEDYPEEVDLLIVVNIYRPETNSKENIIHLIHQIEDKSGRLVTGLINNTNLLKETTYETVLEGQKILKEVEIETGLPILYTSIQEDIDCKDIVFSGEKLPLKVYLRKKWY